MRAVFVVGTGRSGTHFTIRLMNGFERAIDPLNGEEHASILKDVARSAIHHKLPSEATKRYYAKMLGRMPGVFLDQHHPNLFFMRHWQESFGNILFLFVDRPICQVVASMLHHSGVLRWYSYAREWKQRTVCRVPFPNQFLGLQEAAQLRTLPAHLLCAHRVIAHRKAYEKSLGPMKGAVRAVRYESLVCDPYAEFSRVFSADEMSLLGTFSLVEKPDPASLAKFGKVLTKNQVSDILELERLSTITPG